jgi:hypothetical protein
MDVRSLLSSHLSPVTLKKVSWYLKVPSTQSVDEYFLAAPLRDEVATITAFSKYTRGIAGEDPDAPPDDAEEERRWRQLLLHKHQHSAINGQGQAVNSNTTLSTTATSSAASNANMTAGSNLSGSGTVSNSNQERQNKQSQAAAKRRKTQAANGERTQSAQSQQQFPIVEEGRKVAAKLNDGWMMMTVLKFNKRTRLYTLEDADDQAEEKEEHEVARDLVVPLACPEYTPPVFSASARVLAVYPGTTSFYPATVQKAMKRPIPSAKQTGKPVYDYMLQFEDDDEGSDGETVLRKVKGDFVIEEVVV